MAHRRVGERSLTHLPALAEIARDAHPLVVVMKSAQVGLTELEVNLALHTADTGYAGRGNVLFLMPNQNQMDDFARSRFDRAIQDSAYLRERLQPEPPRRKGADSMRLKRVGDGYIYLRGADSQRQIASVDADLVILDEFDQMGEGVLELAEKRIASSRAGRIVVASTPRYPEAGIDALFRESDRRRYLLPCPSCGLEQALTWAANVDQERALRSGHRPDCRLRMFTVRRHVGQPVRRCHHDRQRKGVRHRPHGPTQRGLGVGRKGVVKQQTRAVRQRPRLRPFLARRIGINRTDPKERRTQAHGCRGTPANDAGTPPLGSL